MIFTSAECAPTAEDDVGEQALPQVEVNAVDGVHHDLVNAGIFLTYKFWVEEDFRGPEPLWTELYQVNRENHSMMIVCPKIRPHTCIVFPSGSLKSSVLLADSFSSFCGLRAM